MTMTAKIAAQIVDDITHNNPFSAHDVLQGFDHGIEVQMQVSALRGPVGGYKIAWNSSDKAPKAYGFDQPGVGQIQASEILQDGARLKLADYSDLMLEPEVALILAQDLDPAQTQTAETILSATDRFSPAFEVLDRRGGGKHGPSVLAGNVFNAGAILGQPGAGPDSFLGGKVMVAFCGEKILWGQDTAPQHPAEAAAYVANTYGRYGHGLKAGDVIMCGSHTPLLPVSGPGTYVMTMVGLGEVRLYIE